jgi:hypothetical protein
MRDRIRKVMRFSGPRMLFLHPTLALLHLLDGLKTRVILLMGTWIMRATLLFCWRVT